VSAEDRFARGYRGVLRLYPRTFREEYGDDMELLAREQYRAEPAPRVVVRTLFDLAISIPNQHLEVHMSGAPSLQTALAYSALAVAGLAVALVGGSAPIALVVGLVVAVGAGVVAAVAWKRSAPARSDRMTAGWWKFVIAGPVLVGAVILAAGLGVEAWFLGMLTVLLALVSTGLGLILGVAHLVNLRGRHAAA
jgi:hypothetical protein